MCNFLHTKNTIISEEGKGFKVVVYRLGISYSLVRRPVGVPSYDNVRRIYRRNVFNGWATWNSPLKRGNGFCIFLNRKDAEICFRYYQDKNMLGSVRLVEVDYKQGLGKHIETKMANRDLEIAIVKQFRITKVIKKVGLEVEEEKEVIDLTDLKIKNNP